MTVGILAFGSLITHPGKPILEATERRIQCTTPFKIEYGRISAGRNEAPTLIPVEDTDVGKPVNAIILVLKDGYTLQDAKNLLYNRERWKPDANKRYVVPDNPTSNNILIPELDDFEGVDKVIYTSFLKQSEYMSLDAASLAEYAIKSFKADGGKSMRDGIHYLLNAKNAGIETELSTDYENAILKATGSTSLEDAIKVLGNK
jgi:hypothetical protein